LLGVFGGAVLYENPTFVNPNHLRAAQKQSKANRFINRARAKETSEENRAKHQLEPDALDDVFGKPNFDALETPTNDDIFAIPQTHNFKGQSEEDSSDDSSFDGGEDGSDDQQSDQQSDQDSKEYGFEDSDLSEE